MAVIFISNKMLFRMHNVYNVLYPVLFLHKKRADFEKKTKHLIND